jgi:putative N6-adenine-specific DNA methylase
VLVKARTSSSKQPNRLSLFAVTAPGLEPLCAAELEALGERPKVEDGGVSWQGDMKSLMRANLWLRTATRVLVRVAEFKAKAFFELELNAKKVPWAQHTPRNAAVEFRVTCRKSKLYHSGAVAQRLGAAVKGAVKNVTIADAASDDDDVSGKRQMYVVRFFHDVATVSADSSGAPLHMRGYRQQLAKAPLRETLAAAILLGAEWDGTSPLVDPMCGSGTIAIEAARLARRIAPGRDRSFSFFDWPDFDRDAWTKLLDDAKANELPASPVPIGAADRDEGAIAAARANAKRGGVLDDIEFRKASVSTLGSAPPPGLVVSNPPYGVRIGESSGLRDLYAQLGNVMRSNLTGWRLALFSADKQLERQTKLPFVEKFKTKNGGIPVHLVVADV